MPFLLITPTDGSPGSRANLRALVDSLAHQRVRCELVLVLRGTDVSAIPPLPENVSLLAVRAPLSTSLSEARNLALSYARAAGLLDACTAVAFPDDDCAYPAGTLRRALDRFERGEDMVCGVYAPSPAEVDWKRFPPRAQKVDNDLIMRSQSSGTMFFTSRVVARVGDFDERLGLGARFGAAEDADYMIRALAAGAAGSYDPHLLVLHPYKRHRHGQYFPGNVAVLAKHAYGEGRTLSPLLRRLTLGLLLLGRRQLSPSAYLAGLRAAFHMLGVTGRVSQA